MYPHPAALLLRLLLSLCGIGFAVGFPIAYGLKESYSQYFAVDPVIFYQLVFLCIRTQDGQFRHVLSCQLQHLICSLCLLFIILLPSYFLYFLLQQCMMINEQEDLVELHLLYILCLFLILSILNLYRLSYYVYFIFSTS